MSLNNHDDYIKKVNDLLSCFDEKMTQRVVCQYIKGCDVYQNKNNGQINNALFDVVMQLKLITHQYTNNKEQGVKGQEEQGVKGQEEQGVPNNEIHKQIILTAEQKIHLDKLLNDKAIKSITKKTDNKNIVTSKDYKTVSNKIKALKKSIKGNNNDQIKSIKDLELYKLLLQRNDLLGL